MGVGRPPARTALARQAQIVGIELALALVGSAAMVIGARSLGSRAALEFVEATFLIAVVLFLGNFVVRLERGYLRLTMIGTQAAAMLLTAPLAGLVGLIAGLSWFGRSREGYRYLGVGATVFWTASAALLRTWIDSRLGVGAWVSLVVVAVWMTLINWTHTLWALSVITGEPVAEVGRTAFTRSFLAAFAYFSLAAVLLSRTLNGTASGYALASVVALLAVALTETLGERNRRTALEAQMADRLRHAGYGNALEGVTHAMRHQLAISKGYVENVLERKVNRAIKADAEAAKLSINAALDSLDRLTLGFRPRLSVRTDPFDLVEVGQEALTLVKGRAVEQGTSLGTIRHRRPIWVFGDPAMLREVVVELCLNALDAVEKGGKVTVSLSRRPGGWAALSVADTGPGIDERHREHLFEPHVTTKAAGTGMGLFTAFGVIHEHQGKLVYEGGQRPGAVFTILLPVARRSGQVAKPVAVAGDGLNPAMLAERLSR